MEYIDWSKIMEFFKRYLEYNPGYVGGGLKYSSIPRWMADRRKAYEKYSTIFNPENLSNMENVCKGYKNWLLASENKSWTNLQRIGSYALETPKELCYLLEFIQDEYIPIEEKVQSGLSGNYKVYGVGKAILTGLLHTFYPDKYGVWNGSTEKAFKKLNIFVPFTSKGLGYTYTFIDDTLCAMASKVNSNLTYVDGFMWFVATRLPRSIM